jgi:uncharacterized protein
MRVKRFVLDANILFSYFISKQEHYLASLIFENELTVFYCDELIAEIKRVAEYSRIKKYGIRPKAVVDFIKMSAVHHSLTYPLRNYIPEDKDDNYIVALALQTNSGFITSGDKHILSQRENLEKKYYRLKIITKAEFEEKFSS